MTRKFSYVTRSVTGAVFALLGLQPSLAAPPLEKTGPCPPLARTNTYDGIDVTGLFSTAISGTRSWQARPPAEMVEQGDIQEPLSPAASINCIQVPEGLKVQLVASELTPGPAPAPAYLMYFTFDDKGRMWAVDNRDYPYVHTGATPAVYSSNRATGGTGRILVFEDTDGDGSMDRYKVFYSGLMGPTSIEYVPGHGEGRAGVIVTVPPFVYFLPKSSGNPDTAGAITPVVSGLGSAGTIYDTHFQISNLTAGLDNFYYGHTGSNGCGSPVVGTNRAVGGCGGGTIWRFKATALGADTNTFQLHSLGGSANAHGIGQMEDGQWFRSYATNAPHANHQIRHNTAVTNIVSGPRGNDYWPLTRDLWLWEGSTTARDSVNVAKPGDYYTANSAASGHDFYTARLLPRKYWNRFSFVCEGASKLCNQDSLSLSGSTWRVNRLHGKSRSNIFASTDAWTAPLKVRTGPDGALWVLDWYNYVFLHNPMTPAIMSAWINPLRAKSRARVYRIIPANGTTDPVLNLENASVAGLLQTLGHSNMHWRISAQKLLLNRAYDSTSRVALIDSLYRILTTDSTVEDTALGTSPRVLHALWTVSGLKPHTFDAEPMRWDTAMRRLLLHPAWTVRRNTILALPLTTASANALKSTCALNDPHPHVRIQALDVFARRSNSLLNDTLRAYWPMPLPDDGPAASVSGLRDTHAAAAFTTASTLGLVVNEEGSARPPACPELGTAGIPPPVSLRSARAFSERRDLDFLPRAGGFALASSAQLGSGELVVHDARGIKVFSSKYEAATRRWSPGEARGLKTGLYAYSYREAGGAVLRGRITTGANP